MKMKIPKLKYLIIITFIIPTISYSKSYLCIAENTAGVHQNYGKGSFESRLFKPTEKQIIKKINGEWKVLPFGKDDGYARFSGCEDPEGTNILRCTTMYGGFTMNLKLLRFFSYSQGDWTLNDEAYMGDTSISVGSCSSL